LLLLGFAPELLSGEAIIIMLGSTRISDFRMLPHLWLRIKKQ